MTFNSKLLVAIAMLFSVSSARAGVSAPSVNVGLKSLKVGSGDVGVSSLTDALDLSVQSEVSNGVTLGANVGFGEAAANPIKNVYGRVKQTLMGRKMDADLSFDFDDNAVSGDVNFGGSEEQGALTASVNTNADGFMVESLKYSRKGRGWRVSPTLRTKDFELDLECETDVGSPDTHAKLSLNSEGEGAVKVTHALGDDLASISLEASTGLEDVKLGVSKDLNGGDDKVSTTFHADSKSFSLDWTHQLGSSFAGGGRQLAASVDQKSQQVDLTLESSDSDNDDWAVKLSAPWSSPKDADITVGRKFSMGSLKLPAIRAKGE